MYDTYTQKHKRVSFKSWNCRIFPVVFHLRLSNQNIVQNGQKVTKHNQRFSNAAKHTSSLFQWCWCRAAEQEQLISHHAAQVLEKEENTGWLLAALPQMQADGLLSGLEALMLGKSKSCSIISTHISGPSAQLGLSQHSVGLFSFRRNSGGFESSLFLRRNNLHSFLVLLWENIQQKP